MPLGGYCTVCERWVWVQPHGECQYGHLASDVREIQQLSPQRHARQRWLEHAPASVVTRRAQYRWWWRHSLWILWTFSLGFLNWLSFFYIGVRARSATWIASGFAYLLPVLLTLGSVGTGWLRFAVPLQLFASAASVLHAFAARPHYRAVMFGDMPQPRLEAPPKPPALPSAARPELPRSMDEETTIIIRAAQDRIDAMSETARGIGAQEVREKVARLCETAEKILAELISTPAQIEFARAFLSYYLEAAERIVGGYADLSLHGVRAPDVEATLAHAVASLDSVQQAFDKELAAVLQRDLIDLDSEIALLEKTVQMDRMFEPRPPAARPGGER